jgi:hypothetical protein
MVTSTSSLSLSIFLYRLIISIFIVEFFHSRVSIDLNVEFKLLWLNLKGFSAGTEERHLIGETVVPAAEFQW